MFIASLQLSGQKKGPPDLIGFFSIHSPWKAKILPKKRFKIIFFIPNIRTKQSYRVGQWVCLRKNGLASKANQSKQINKWRFASCVHMPWHWTEMSARITSSCMCVHVKRSPRYLDTVRSCRWHHWDPSRRSPAAEYLAKRSHGKADVCVASAWRVMSDLPTTSSLGWKKVTFGPTIGTIRKTNKVLINLFFFFCNREDSQDNQKGQSKKVIVYHSQERRVKENSESFVLRLYE